MVLGLPAFANKIYTDGALINSHWQTIILSQEGTTQLQFTHVPSNGNPGAYQQVTFQVGQTQGGTSVSARTVRYRNDFSWDPAVDGPLGSMSLETAV